MGIDGIEGIEGIDEIEDIEEIEGIEGIEEIEGFQSCLPRAEPKGRVSCSMLRVLWFQQVSVAA